MLPSLAYAVVRLLLDLALLRCRSGTTRDLELLVLRHEVRVLRRGTKRIAWRPGDRLVFAALSRCPRRPARGSRWAGMEASAKHPVLVVYYRHAADPTLGEQASDLFHGGGGADSDDIGGHDLSSFHR